MKALRLRARGIVRVGISSGGRRGGRRSKCPYIAFDAHKHYTLASVARPDGHLVGEERIDHDRGALRQFLERCQRGSPVAVETIGNWYWIVDEIEAAGCVPKLVQPARLN